MKTQEIRRLFLDYFKANKHRELSSSSLIPAGDPTLLFVNAGMVQFKDCFLGMDKRDYNRATTSQKCLRISGKHNDLENVGRTARHHTFFEMLGNFSFGDYFKKDAIKFAWTFLTKDLGLDKKRLWVTIFEDDDEAKELWEKHTDVLSGRILKCGEKDNFWAMGDTGPCGPCSEIHYYLGEDEENQSEEEFRKDDGTYIEIWNLVFMQFNRDASKKLTKLPKPSVDTGMGLERIAAVKQGVKSNYDIDLMRSIISYTESLSDTTYVGEDYTERDINTDTQYSIDVAHRVICDHVRAVAFLIADGVLPSSDGRGYVMRRLIRRASRHGRNLGFREAFLYKVAGKVIELMGSSYKELEKEKSLILEVLKKEEEKFIETLGSGIKLLDKEILKLKENNSTFFPGNLAFTLHDTYGFPLDMTSDIVTSKGFFMDEEGFKKAMEEQKERSRKNRASDKTLLLQNSVTPLKTEFVGYEFSEYESSVLGIFNEDGEVTSAKEGEEVCIVSVKTPFYAESGGQVGDTGTISSNTSSIEVLDTQKTAGDTISHICKVVEGEISKGDNIRLVINLANREKTKRHHSSTHLLHFALRKVLGDHIKQAGSRVSPTSLRFDFTHNSSLSDSQIKEIENIVNREIISNHKVNTKLMELEEAKRSGAISLFDEKYSKDVRVVSMGEDSVELCGGTHVNRTGDIGAFFILSEGGISSGVRRIEAFSSYSAINLFQENRAILNSLTSKLNVSRDKLEDRISSLILKNKELQKNKNSSNGSLNLKKTTQLESNAIELEGGAKLVSGVIESLDQKQLREASDKIKQNVKDVIVVLGSDYKGKAILLVSVSESLIKKYHAGALIKEISKVLGCKGGGKAEFAQAGGGDLSKLSLLTKKVRDIVNENTN